jgi:hypothetical protein
VDLVLAHPGVSRVAGEIVAAASYWYLSNFSSRSFYLVENPEGAGEHVKVAPGRERVPIPFEISDVVIPAGRATVTFQVYAPDQPCLVRRAGIDDAGEHVLGECTVPSFPLDRMAKYFLVLVALCEPKLRGRAMAALPTAGEVAGRLRSVPGCEDLTGRAVDFHIDYLVRHKLRLRVEPEGTGFAPRRELLAGFALRFGLVHEDDLRLLPRPVRRGPVGVTVSGRRGATA